MDADGNVDVDADVDGDGMLSLLPRDMLMSWQATTYRYVYSGDDI